MSHAKQKWLLALDVDRTLLTDDYRLLPSVRDAVQHARVHGVAVVLATARGPLALEVVLRDLGDVDLSICFGGALVVAGPNANWIDDLPSLEQRLQKGDALRVIGLARTIGIPLALYTRDIVFVDQIDANLAREFSHTGDRYSVCDLTEVNDVPFKFLATCPPDQTQRLEVFKNLLAGALSCVRSHETYLEIGPRGVSKGAALARVAAARNIDKGSVIAIGDSENDLSMLAFAGHPIAMGNAAESVKRAALWVTNSNDEGGVATAIARCAVDLWGVPAPSKQEVNMDYVSAI